MNLRGLNQGIDIVVLPITVTRLVNQEDRCNTVSINYFERIIWHEVAHLLGIQGVDKYLLPVDEGYAVAVEFDFSTENLLEFLQGVGKYTSKVGFKRVAFILGIHEQRLRYMLGLYLGHRRVDEFIREFERLTG